MSQLLEDDVGDEAHRARILLMTGLILVAVGTVFLLIQLVLWTLPAYPPPPLFDLFTDVAVALAGAAVVWLVASGRPRPATWLVLGCLLLFAAAQVYWDGNPTTGVAGVLTMLLFVAMAMVLLDGRAPWLAYSVAAATFIALHLFWLQGRLPPPIDRSPTSHVFFSIFTWLAASGVIAGVIYTTTKALRNQAAVLRDHVFDLQETTQALQASERRFRRLAESTPAAILIIQDGKVVYANPFATTLSEYGPDELQGMRFLDLVHPDHQGLAESAVRAFVRNREAPQRGELKIVTATGQVRWVDYSGLLMDYQGSTAFLTSAFDITQRRRAEEELHRHAERLRVLHAIDGVILAAWSPQEIANAALRHIRRLVACTWSGVITFDPAVTEGVLQARNVDGSRGADVGARFVAGEVFDVGALQQGGLQVVRDVKSSPDARWHIEQLMSDAVRSYTVVPLIAKGELIGALALGSDEAGAFTTEDLDVINEIGGQVAVGIQQARLQEQVRRHASDLEHEVAARSADLARRTAQLQVAAEIARDATTARDLNSLMDLAVNLIRDRFGFYHAAIYLLDKDSESAVLQAAAGQAGEALLGSGHQFKVRDRGLVSHVIATGQPRIDFDVGASTRRGQGSHLPASRSEMTLPLHVGGRVIGALDVQSTEAGAFTGDDVETLQIMADQLAVAIERTSLFEEAQRALERQLQTVVSNTPVILFATDRDGRVTLMEGRGLSALGLEPGEAVGAYIFDTQLKGPGFCANFRRALGGEELTAIVELGELAFETWYAPLRDDLGDIAGVIGVATDITERRMLEKQMQRQDRLAAVGQLAGGIAHDFNNLLTSIILYAHMPLRDPELSPDLVRTFNTILDESRRASELVQQILDFSRRSPMKTETLDLTYVVEQTVRMLKRTFPENIVLRPEWAPGDYRVDADPTRMEQVLMNLSLNARDAMPEGGELRIGLAEISLRSGQTPPAVGMSPGPWVCLTVADTGTGIAHDVLPRIFEPFFTTKEPGKGTGLGLAQVHGIVGQHGGYIDVETMEGAGTTFYVYLPASPLAVAEADVKTAALAAPAGRGETILFVEDNDRIRELGAAFLLSLDYDVVSASNGREAMAAYAACEDVDLVITDLVMPEMGGRELLDELRKDSPGLRALAITGHALQDDLRVLKEAGFAATIIKPFDADVLAVRVREVLDSGG